MIETFLARRPLEIGDEIRAPGDLAPEAHLWPLRDGLVTNGFLEPTTVSEADFATVVERYCPDSADEIYEVLGLTPVKGKTPEKRASSHPPKTVLATQPEAVDENDEPAEKPKTRRSRAASKKD